MLALGLTEMMSETAYLKARRSAAWILALGMLLPVLHGSLSHVAAAAGTAAIESGSGLAGNEPVLDADCALCGASSELRSDSDGAADVRAPSARRPRLPAASLAGLPTEPRDPALGQRGPPPTRV
jgi:hypothetical protein